MAKIGEAAYDERGALAYGQPGDQTGFEVRISDFYIDANRPWAKVFRAKKDDVRKKLALAMTQACQNENIGYAQYGDGSTPYKDRYGLNEALKQASTHTIPDVTIPCNCDCSSLVAQCCRAAGIDVQITMYTAYECQILRNTGAFDELDFSEGMKLVAGDIMWRNGHTAIITSEDDEYDKSPKWVGKITQYCNVYNKPSLNSGLLKDWPHLGKDNLIDVCDDADEFYYVRIAGKYFGFVLTKFVGNVEPEPTPTPTPTCLYTGKAITELNLRVGPGTQYGYCNVDRNDGLGVRHTLKQGETAPVIAEQDGWDQVRIDGESTTWTPWCSGKYIVKVSNEPKVGDKITMIGNNLKASKVDLSGEILAINGDMYQVKLSDGCIGYVAKGDFNI